MSNKMKNGNILYDTMLPSAATANIETLTENKTLADNDAQIQMLNPGVADRNVTLPVASDSNHPFYVVNTSSSRNLTVKNNGGITIATLSPGGTAILISSGQSWVNVGMTTVTESTIQLSDNTINNVSTSKHGFAPKAPGDTRQFLRGDATWATPYRVGLNVVTTATSVTNTTAETTLYTFSVPGGTLSTNRMLRLRLDMTSTHFNATGTLRLKYGGTTLVTLSFPSTGGSNHVYAIDLMLRGNGATNSQVALAVRSGAAAGNGSGTASEDSTQNRNLVMTWQYSAAVAETTTLHAATLELMYPM